MTPSANQEPPKARPPVPSQEHEDAINDFFSFIGRLSDRKSYLSLKSIVLDNNTLRKELDNTKTAYDRNLKELTQRTADWNAAKEELERKMEDQTKQCRKVTEEKATAYRKLKAEQDTATGLKAKIAAQDDDAGRLIANSKKLEERITKLDETIARQAKQLEAASKEAAMLKEKVRSTGDQLRAQSEALTAAESNLRMFRSFTATLTPLEDVRVSISEMLGSSFKEASDLFRSFFGRDLDGDRLQDSRSWDRIRNHMAIQRGIPLPASNSVHAKQMRPIAGLVVYARALAEYVFRPTYLSVGTGADDILDALPAANSFQDTLVRAVLLEVLPDHQKKRRDACAERVVEEVSAVLVAWLPADQHATFKSRLDHLTSVLCGQWQRVQKLHERVEPCFDFDAPDDWQTLPRWADPVPSDNSARTMQPRQGNIERQSKQQEPESAALSTGDIVKIVWPAFLATNLEHSTDEEEGTSDLVHHGYVLTHADVRGAANEDMPRRAMRRAARDSNVAAPRKRRDSAIFLSHEASDGSDVK